MNELKDLVATYKSAKKLQKKYASEMVFESEKKADYFVAKQIKKQTLKLILKQISK
jgi:hypothetical protein